MDSFSAEQCPWAVNGVGGQILRAAVAVRATYTIVISHKLKAGENERSPAFLQAPKSYRLKYTIRVYSNRFNKIYVI